MYQAYMRTTVHEYRRYMYFRVNSPNLFVQNLDADESSGKLSVSNADFVGIFQLIHLLVLLEKRTEALLRQTPCCIILAP